MNRTPEQWALIDANWCAHNNSHAANYYLLSDAQKDIAALAQQLAASQSRLEQVEAQFEIAVQIAVTERKAISEAQATITHLEATIIKRDKRLAEAEVLLGDVYHRNEFSLSDDIRIDAFLSPAEDKAND